MIERSIVEASARLRRQHEPYLIATVVAVRDIAHRLLFSPDSGAQGRRVDLLPFGGVEQPTHTIAWPPDMHIIMHVAGFSEALQTALLVQVATGLIIRVASLAGLALLKLLAWRDRGLEDHAPPLG